MTVLLDSWAWLQYFFGSKKGEQVRPHVDDPATLIIVTKINVFEVYQKILKERGREQAERFTHFILNRGFLDDLDTDTLKLAAEEKHRFGLGMADAIILASAVKHGATIYTGDPDFERTKDVVKTVFL